MILENSNPTPRRLYNHSDLVRLIEPSSVAVVGATPTAGAFGHRTIINLAEFGGRIYPVNGKYSEIEGHRCFQSLDALPEVPDCVIIALPQTAVRAAVVDCARLGAGGAIIYASGFAESGKAELINAQKELVQIASSAGLRLAGPNCIGLVNVGTAACMHFMPGLPTASLVRGNIGIVSQSGALGFSLLQAVNRGLGFSHCLAAGNSADVDICDYISYLAQDPRTKAIICVMEGVVDGKRFIEAGRLAFANGKTLLVYKAGRSEVSSEVALSHTGAMVGDARAFQAALDKMGAVNVHDFASLMEMAAFFSKVGTPLAGSGVGVMCTSGGTAVIAADVAAEKGVPLPPLLDQTQSMLRGVIPEYGRVANPCDATAEVLKAPRTVQICVEAFLEDPGCSALVIPVSFASEITSGQRIRNLGEMARGAAKPICVVWMSAWLGGPGVEEAEAHDKLVLFRSMDRCFSTLATWLALGERRLARSADTGTWADINQSAVQQAVERIEEGSAPLTERQAKQVLSCYGVPVTDERLATSESEVLKAASQLGFPLALKIESPDIAHKTEVGGVRLAVQDVPAALQAYREILDSAARAVPSARLNGVLIQQMIPDGVELALGTRRDVHFGPLVMVGFGGVLIELLQDTAVRIAPVSREQAKAMLLSLRGARLLAGFRGSKPVDIDAIADLISRVSQLAVELEPWIEQLDVNPLIASEAGVTVADALIVPRTGRRADAP